MVNSRWRANEIGTASNSAEKKNRPREGVAEGGFGGDSATPERIQKESNINQKHRHIVALELFATILTHEEAHKNIDSYTSLISIALPIHKCPDGFYIWGSGSNYRVSHTVLHQPS